MKITSPIMSIGRPNIISTSQLKNINGKFNYIVTKDGVLVIGRASNMPGGGHIDLACGEPVRVAGEIKFVNGQLVF